MDIVFQEFIDLERGRFDTRENNLFAFAFRDISTYRAFLGIIGSRYESVGAAYTTSSDELHERMIHRGNATTTMSLDDEQLLQRVGRLGLELRLEIESFYLFAYILLDKVAAAIAFYFEGNATTGWHKHATLIKRFDDYTRNKGLTNPDRFSELASALGQHIAGFRNFQIVHEAGMRAIRGTGWRTGEGARLTVSNLYPDPDEPHYETRPLNQLLAEIDDYLSLVIQVITLNRDHTPLPKSQV